MQNLNWTYLLLFGVILILTGMGVQPVKQGQFELEYPASWPSPKYNFEQNPLTHEKVELGRKLFYDPILSRDNTVSCASCHSSYTAFTHVDHDLSHGIDDRIGTRNSPALMNLAWHTLFMWDGAVNHLDVQALAPISHPDEMGEDIAHVVYKLQYSGTYPGRFYHAFGDSTITGQHVLQALAQFQLTLVSANSKYDQVKRNEPGVQFTDQEETGYRLFQQNCASCHVEPFFTSHQFANNGLAVDTTLNDYGRYKVTQQPADSLMFKVPTLRNIEFSKPYMHDGRFETLYEVLNHYTTGIVNSTTLDKGLQAGVSLSEREKIDLVAFLLTLNDKGFLFNPDFAFPQN